MSNFSYFELTFTTFSLSLSNDVEFTEKQGVWFALSYRRRFDPLVGLCGASLLLPASVRKNRTRVEKRKKCDENRCRQFLR